MIKECLPKVEIKFLKISYVRMLFLVSLLLNKARAGLCWYLEIAFIRYVCMCVSAPVVINN